MRTKSIADIQSRLALTNLTDNGIKNRHGTSSTVISLGSIPGGGMTSDLSKTVFAN